MRRARLIGVDFSGARLAGDHLWVATGIAGDDGLSLETCMPARELPGGGRERDAALSALVRFLAGETSAAVGLDFPFSLPASLITEESWQAFARGFAARYPAPEDFRDACRRQTGGKEIKRRTDIEAKVPFCVFNLRLYRQTHAGIASVLAPLLDSGSARIVPMQAPAAGHVTIAEICPASLLKRLDLYAPYKGRGPALAQARGGLIAALIERRLLSPPAEALRTRIIEDPGGDALDAVLAAIGAGLLPHRLKASTDPIERIEGRVYF